MSITAVDFKKISVSREVRKQVEPVLASWRSLHPFLRDEETSEKNLNLLSCMLSLELKSPNPRQRIIARLHMRINAMRRELELNKMPFALVN